MPRNWPRSSQPACSDCSASRNSRSRTSRELPTKLPRVSVGVIPDQNCADRWGSSRGSTAARSRAHGDVARSRVPEEGRAQAHRMDDRLADRRRHPEAHIEPVDFPQHRGIRGIAESEGSEAVKLAAVEDALDRAGLKPPAQVEVSWMLGNPRAGEAVQRSEVLSQTGSDGLLEVAAHQRDFDLHSHGEAQLRAVARGRQPRFRTA
jgi:hypothetical protein